MPMVIKLMLMTDGPVMELGSGVFSTPLLHWLCHGKGRTLISYEDSEEYFQFARKFRSRNHRVRFVKDWDQIDMGGHWDVVLIDHSIHRRSIDALRLKDSTDYIILHDSEAPELYGYDKLYPNFKYIYHWKGCQAWTTVVSNFKDLSEL